MIESKSIQQGAVGVSILVPILIVFMSKMMGVGPVTVNAEQTDTTTQSTVITDIKGNITQQVGSTCAPATQHIQTLTVDTTQPANPFFYAEPLDEPIIDIFPMENSNGESFMLMGIMSGSNPMAIINGRLVTAGEQLNDTWTVQSIDTTLATVTIIDTDGKTKVITTEAESGDESEDESADPIGLPPMNNP